MIFKTVDLQNKTVQTVFQNNLQNKTFSKTTIHPCKILKLLVFFPSRNMLGGTDPFTLIEVMFE